MSKSFKKTPRKFDDDFLYGTDDVDIRDKTHRSRDDRRAAKELLKNFEDTDTNKDRRDFH